MNERRRAEPSFLQRQQEPQKTSSMNNLLFLPFGIAALAVLLSASPRADAGDADAGDPVAAAVAALAAGDAASAAVLLEARLAAAPEDAAALHHLSRVRLVQQRNGEAVELARRATALDATQADYFAQLGSACAAQMPELGLMQQAMAASEMRMAFERALTLDPRHVGALIGLARYFAHAPAIAGGSLQRAAELAERVREVNPLLGEVELGMIAERGEQWETALAHYRAALELRPNSARLQEACGRVLERLGRKDEAEAFYDTARRSEAKARAAQK
jgi:tetratricopeptide (TPR) repeat protein